MRNVKRWAGITLGAGVLVGAGIIGWAKLHPTEEAAVVSRGGSVPLDMSATPTSASSDLQVRPADPDSAQAAMVGGGNNPAGTSGSVAGSSTGNTGGGAAVPGPADFKQYDQYKTNESALYGDLVVGQGAAVAAGSVVTVSYKGWLTSGALFDESAPNKPFTFTEGEHRVIAGWEQALFGMKAGGKRRLIVPPAVGYGAEAHGPIPGGSVLVFDVELLSVK